VEIRYGTFKYKEHIFHYLQGKKWIKYNKYS
jgi:hypothetical protein